MASRYGPGVLPRGRDYQGLADAFLRGRDRRRQRERQDRFDQMATEQHTANLHRQGYRIGERPTTQVYEPAFEGTVFDPARAQMPAVLPNAFTGTPTAPQTGANPFATALGNALLAWGDQPRLKALPGAFVPETGTFTDRPLFEQPAVPFRIGAGRMVERPDMSYERVGDNLWFSEERSPEGRQMARAALMADAERLNQEAAAEVERNRLAEALSRLENLTPAQRGAIAAGVPLNVATYQTGMSEAERMRLAHGYRMAEIDAQNKWRMGDPNDPTGASATSRLNRYAQAVGSVSSALERYQSAYIKEWGEPPSREQLENFLRNTFNIGLDEYYAMQGELFKLWGVGGSEAAQPPQAIQNPFLVPNPLADMGGTGAGSVLGDALRRAAAGGRAQVGPTREAAAALDTRQVITADQADYLRVVQGWTDDQINARYRVQ